ncbi:MAG: glycosyltransferase family 2 protein, partial [Anaerolineales bacterium]|nr:glycosyltransferase family 2 protein [Anaerolineales bacterium]
YRDFEIILIDNGSKDIQAIEDLIKKHENLNIVFKKNQENLGFAAANNLGVNLAKGKWIALLNADAFPEPDWLKNLLSAAQENPHFSFFASRQIQYGNPELLDGAGDAYHTSGLAWRIYYNQPTKEFGLEQQEVFSACAAAALYLKEDFLKIGGFDEIFFSYFEDVDLSFRLRLFGKRCLYVPHATVYHVGSASTGKASDFAVYYGHRNLVWAFFKNMPTLLCLWYLPFHLLTNIYISLAFLIREKRSIVIKSKLDAFRSLPKVLRNRSSVQKMRTASAWDINRAFTKGLLAPRRASRARTKKQ